MNRSISKSTTATTIAQVFANIASKHPHAIALVYHQEYYTFRELHKLSFNLANSLTRKYKVKKGDLIALSLSNSPEWVVSLLAILQIGAIVCPIEGWNLQEFRSLFSSHRVPVAIVDNERLFRLDSILKTEKETSQLNGVILCRSPTNGMLPFVDHWRSVVQDPIIPSESTLTDEILAQLLHPTLTRKRRKVAEEASVKMNNLKSSDVAIAIPVVGSPFRGSSLVEITHDDWFLAMGDGIHMDTIEAQLQKDAFSSVVTSTSSISSTPSTPSTLNNPISVFCPVPLLTLLKGETVQIRQSKDDSSNTLNLLQNKEIDWSSCWLQPLQQTMRMETTVKEDHVDITGTMQTKVLVVDSVSTENIDRKNCEAFILSQPNVTAASMFTDVTESKLWVAVIMDERHENDSLTLTDLWEKIQDRYQNSSGLTGLIKWQQRSIKPTNTVGSRM